MSAVEFDERLMGEIDRLDDLYNDIPARAHARIDDPTLELPGMAVIASRTSALRRELLARIANRQMPHLNISNPETSLVLIPNHGAQIFIRQMLSDMSKVSFEDLDEGSISDDDWPHLTSGVNLLTQGSDQEKFVDSLRFKLITSALSATQLIDLIAAEKPGATVILENYHLLRGLSESGSTIVALRNAATTAGIYLYIGCGLSHWHELRERGGIYLSDLAESVSEVVHVADLITILTPNISGAQAAVFDARYSAPWKGELSRLLGR